MEGQPKDTMKIRIVDVARRQGQWLLVFEVTTPRFLRKPKKELVPIITDYSGDNPTNIITFELEQRPKIQELIKNYIRVSNALENSETTRANRNGDAFDSLLMNKTMRDAGLADSFKQSAFGAMLGAGMVSPRSAMSAVSSDCKDAAASKYATEFDKLEKFRRLMEKGH